MVPTSDKGGTQQVADAVESGVRRASKIYGLYAVGGGSGVLSLGLAFLLLSFFSVAIPFQGTVQPALNSEMIKIVFIVSTTLIQLTEGACRNVDVAIAACL
ncbi:uncharacterized protein BDW43DRAFT_267002, partial [Aspergillus alliaceus]|uniref:uncharacterized protein n=1 Tax=Petromyces alliaceus TaxID=209559 RepID=UPI0012A6C31F